MRQVQKQRQRHRREGDGYDQPWPVPGLDVMDADTSAIDAALEESED